ncbi:MAG: hypothetical protein QW165_03320 [Candidatus Woesearchaeota archaeon]
MPSTWTPVVFWILLVPLLIIMLIVYLRSKKFSRLVFILSVFTYAMAVMYWIDAYQLGRNAIVLLLVLSSLLMIFVGWLIHREKKEKPWGGWKLATACMVVIATIVTLSASQIGWTVTSSSVPSIKLSELQTVIEEGQPSYPVSYPIYTVTVTNTFIPRQYELPQASACLYNAENKAASNANVFWDVAGQPSDFGIPGNILEVGRGSKTATLKISQNPYYKPVPREVKQPVPFEPPVWNELYLFLNTGRTYQYIDCYNFDSLDKSKAIKILITQD